jgi:hypothetical protein
MYRTTIIILFFLYMPKSIKNSTLIFIVWDIKNHKLNLNLNVQVFGNNNNNNIKNQDNTYNQGKKVVHQNNIISHIYTHKGDFSNIKTLGT